jgi:transposase-like protein
MPSIGSSDNHVGLPKALTEVLTDATWQRCYVHFLRNALDYLPRKADDDCLQELRRLYDRRDLAEAQRPRDVADEVVDEIPKLTDLVEDHIGETLTFTGSPGPTISI